jgi:hypothetical protein
VRRLSTTVTVARMLPVHLLGGLPVMPARAARPRHVVRLMLPVPTPPDAIVHGSDQLPIT